MRGTINDRSNRTVSALTREAEVARRRRPTTDQKKSGYGRSAEKKCSPRAFLSFQTDSRGLPPVNEPMRQVGRGYSR